MSHLLNKDILKELKTGKSACINFIKSKIDCDLPPSERAIRHSIEKIVNEEKLIKKSKSKANYHEKIEAFYNATARLPKGNSNLRKSKDTEPINCDCSFSSVASDLANEWHTKSEELNESTHELDQIKDILKEKCEEIAALKRSKITGEKLKLIHLTNEAVKRESVVLKRRVETKNLELRNVRRRNSRLNVSLQKERIKYEQLLARNQEYSNLLELRENEILRLQSDADSMRIQLNDSLAEAEWLTEMVEANSETVQCFDPSTNAFTNELRHCIYSLLEHHVSSRHISPVISAVLNLVNKKPNRLPARTTILDMNTERLVLAQNQISEELSDSNLTLYTDETTKFGTKYGGYHASDSEGRMYALGLRELLTKSGSDTLQTFQEILADIQERSDLIENNNISKKLLTNIVATMSDRASTEMKFNELLQDLRASVLPEMKENWETLTYQDQTSASQVMNFFCGLHSLVHFADVSSKVLIEVEKGLFDGPSPIYDPSFRKQTESGTLRLIRTTSKSLARGGDAKSGKYQDFRIFAKDFLKADGYHTLPLEPFHGNRFNILFENAASVFYLHEQIYTFLEGHQSNNLLKSVLHDLRRQEYLAGSKALGLVSRLVTGPLWCLIEDKSIHILDMNIYYSKLVDFFEVASENIEDFMTGKVLPFGEETRIKKDPVYVSLVKEWKHDDTTALYLSVMFPALATLAKRIFKDHLPGGCWNSLPVTAEVREKTKGVQKHNKYAESVFGYLDHLLREKPNISVLASEAYVMFVSNKTSTWLHAKTDVERQNVITKARKDVKHVKAVFQRRKLEIEMMQKQKIEENIQKQRAKEEKRIEKLESFTSEMIFYGLWQSDEQVNSELDQINTLTEKRKALKAQLNFRKHVLKQKTENSNIYNFSKSINGKACQLSITDLTLNLKTLVRHAFTIPLNEESDATPILTGKNVEHAFETVVDGSRQKKWHRGKIISQVPGYPSLYNIVYQKEQESVYTYQLLNDWKQGDLKLCVM